MSSQCSYKAVPIVMALLVLAAFALAVTVNRFIAQQLLGLVPPPRPSTSLARAPSEPSEPLAEDVGAIIDAGIVIQAAPNEERGAGQRKHKRRRSRGAPVDACDGAADICAQSASRFSIRRSFLARVLASPMGSLRSARVSPLEIDGQQSGLVLHGLGPGNVLSSLGLQNGDVLRSINGQSIATPDSALDAYAKLRGASQFALLVLRSGRLVRFDYTITESN